MDGNGRWARERHLPKIAGHRAGVNTLRKIVAKVKNLGIPFLTVYAFSTENWSRPKEEIGGLLKLMGEYIDKEVEHLDKEKVRINVLGRINKFPYSLRQKIIAAVKRTKKHQMLNFNIALNYGAKDEILRAVKLIASKMRRGRLKLNEISEEVFSAHLYTRGQPDPDLLIRTSGEMRLSNFLLWQSSYSELYFSPKFWPDFTEGDLEAAIETYQERERRFGG